MRNLAKFNYWVDVVFLTTLVVVIFTGFVIWGWMRPEGMRSGITSASASEQTRAVAEGVATTDAAPSAPKHGTAGQGESGHVNGIGESKIFWGLFKGRTFLGMTKRGWNNVHAWVSMAMLLCFILHLKTHFRWLVGMSKKVGKGEVAQQGSEGAASVEE